MKSFKKYLISIAIISSINSIDSAASHNELTNQYFPHVLIDSSMNFPDIYPDLNFGFNALHRNFQQFVLKKWTGKNMQDYVLDEKSQTINIATQIVEQSQNEIVKGFIKNEALRKQFIKMLCFDIYRQTHNLEPIKDPLYSYIGSIDYMKPVVKHYVNSFRLNQKSLLQIAIDEQEAETVEILLQLDAPEVEIDINELINNGSNINFNQSFNELNYFVHNQN